MLTITSWSITTSGNSAGSWYQERPFNSECFHLGYRWHQEFIETLAPVVQLLGTRGIRVHAYLDDSIIRSDSPAHTQETSIFYNLWGGQYIDSRAPSQYKRMAISMLKIRRLLGRLIFNMGIAIPGKTVFLIEMAPRSLTYTRISRTSFQPWTGPYISTQVVSRDSPASCLVCLHQPSFQYIDSRAPSQYKRMAISMLKIRRLLGRLIFNMGIAIPGKTVFLIEMAPRSLTYTRISRTSFQPWTGPYISTQVVSRDSPASCLVCLHQPSFLLTKSLRSTAESSTLLLSFTTDYFSSVFSSSG